MQYQQKVHNAQSTLAFIVKEIPTPQNGFVGVVEATICNDGQCITDFGTADAKSTGSSHPIEVLEKAREEAERIVLHRQSQQSTYSPNRVHQNAHTAGSASQHTFPANSASRKEKSNGGGAKPASEKQIEMITSKCKKLQQNPDDICQKICGCSLSELRGQDAHEVIQSLMH